MNVKEFSKTKKITISALCMALYIVLMLCTQSFAFGQYQIRIATAVYALNWIFPFLVVPLGLANFLSNSMMGGLGPLDMFGGAFVGFLTGQIIVWLKTKGTPYFTIAFPIIFVPGLLVPVWLSVLLDIPYAVLAPSLLIGQVLPAIVGAVLVAALEKKEILSEASEKS